MAQLLDSRLAVAWGRAHERVPWLWPYGWLVAVIVVAMWRAWTTTSGLVVAGDALINYFPWFVLWRDQLGAGELPLWNPYTFSGSPAFAAPHAAYGYPVTWALTVLPAQMALNWFVGLHVLLAGVGTAWAAGRLGASRDGQFLAGVVFALGGVMAARLVSGHIFFIAGMAWLPIATGLAATMNERYRVPALAVVVGLLATSAQPELLIFAGWWLPLWAGAMALQEGRRRALVAVVRSCVGIAFGAGLAAFFLLPASEYQAISNRSGELTWEFRTGISLPLWHLLGLLNPDIFGSSSNGTYWPAEPYVWHENLLFVGLVPLAIACGARGRAAWACFGFAVVAVALAFGHHFPLFGLIDFLPGYDLFRNPPKHLLLAGLALALAAGLGLARVERRSVAIGAAVGAMLLLAGSMTAPAWLPVFVEALGGAGTAASTDELRDLAGTAKTPLLVGSAILMAMAVVAWLAGPWFRKAVIAVAVLELVIVLQPYWSTPSDPDVIAREAASYAGDPDVAVTGDSAFLGNYGPVVKVRQPSGYTSQFSAGYMELLVGGVNPSVVLNATPGEERLLYLLGYEAVTEYESDEVVVFSPPPPRAWVAGCVWPGSGLEVREPDFPIEHCVTHPEATSRDEVVASRPAEVVDEGSRSLTVAAEGPGWLVTTIPWYPGWSVSIDGDDAPVEILDGALVGVELPQGQHTVAFSYWPAGLTLGLVFSALSLMTVIGLVVAERANDPWTRLGLEPANRVVADERDNHEDDEAPQNNRGQAGAT